MFQALQAAGVLGACLALAAGCASVSRPPAPASASVPAKDGSGFLAGPHGRLRIEETGSGTALAVLFVHGNGGNRTPHWSETLRHLGPWRRAAALDLSGFGESEAAPGALVSVEGYAENVAAAADRLGFQRFVLVGHSYGGAVVAACAGAHSDRLAGLVFADCAGDLHGTPEASLAPLRRGLREDYENFTGKWFDGILAGARPETRETVLASLRATRREVFVSATEALYRFDLNAALGRYTGPRISISSMLFDNPVAIHRTLPGMPVRRITGASHWLMMDRPDEFDRVLDEFLATLR